MNKVYVITGAGHFPGIGSCLAEALLHQGIRVAINSRTFDARWQELQDQFPDQLQMIAGNIADPAIQDQLLQLAVDTWGRIDTVVNNASGIEVGANADRNEWNQEFLMNVIVPYELSIKAQDYLTKSNGSIIMIGSRFAIQVAGGTNPAYSIAKAAQHQLTKNLSVQLAPIRVNAVAPGMFESARWSRKFAGKEDARRNEFVNKSLTHSTVSAKSLVDAILFLSQNEHVTGQILPVCAGTSVARI